MLDNVDNERGVSFGWDLWGWSHFTDSIEDEAIYMSSKQNSIVRKCPTCKQPTAWENNPYRPFCSDRCKLIDLGSWADGSYKFSEPALHVDPDDHAVASFEDIDEA